MDKPRSKPWSNNHKSSRQASPKTSSFSSGSATPLQPEAGPSRLPFAPNGLARTATAPSQFSSEVDFIALEEPEDAPAKRAVREWDRGKDERDWKRDGDGETAGRKRRWDEDELDGSNTRDRDAQRPTLKPRKAPWMAHVDWDNCRNVAELLHKEVEAYVNYISPSVVEHEMRHTTVLLIAGSISTAYPDAEVLPFGSFETKLYLPQGDIDLVVKSYAIGSLDKLTALRSLANIVRRTGVTDKVTIISKTKVPIIKFNTINGHFAVDISINRSNGVQAGTIINHFLREFPALRALVLIVKSFLKQRNLNEVYSGGLGSYAIVCLAVSHLQVSKLRTIFHILSYRGTEFRMSFAHARFKMHPKVRRAEIDSAKNLGVLMLEFFELYGKYFNYSNTGISLRHGGTYFSKQTRGWKDYYKPYLLCIEDPGDISNDISRGSFGIKKVKQTFTGAYDMMLQTLYITAEILSARRDKRAVDLRRGSSFERDPAEMSILSSILGVDQETINHRRLVQQVYEEGHLSRLLGIDPLVKVHHLSTTSVTVTNTMEEKRAKEVASISEAWGEADMSESDEEGEIAPGKCNGVKRVAAIRDVEEEEGSRYDISATKRNGSTGSVWKKLRIEEKQSVRAAPAATVFVTDEDGDGEEEEGRDELFHFCADSSAGDVSSSSSGLAEIERAYVAAADELADSSEDEDPAYSKGKGKGQMQVCSMRLTEKPLSSEMRQAYWASKAVQGLGFDMDSS